MRPKIKKLKPSQFGFVKTVAKNFWMIHLVKGFTVHHVWPEGEGLWRHEKHPKSTWESWPGQERRANDYMKGEKRNEHRVAELMQEIAILLFQKEKLSLAQASRLAGMSQLQFQHLLASRQIPVHYDIAELEADLQTLRDMGRI